MYLLLICAIGAFISIILSICAIILASEKSEKFQNKSELGLAIALSGGEPFNIIEDATSMAFQRGNSGDKMLDSKKSKKNIIQKTVQKVKSFFDKDVQPQEIKKDNSKKEVTFKPLNSDLINKDNIETSLQRRLHEIHQDDIVDATFSNIQQNDDIDSDSESDSDSDDTYHQY